MEIPFRLKRLISFLKKIGCVASDSFGSPEGFLRHNSKPHAGESVMHNSSTSVSVPFTRNRLPSVPFGRGTLAQLALVTITSLLLNGVAMGAPAQPTPTPSITVSLPTTSFDISVPIATVITQPITATTITAAMNLVGFQGDFSFDETVVTFSSPPVQ